MPESTLLQDIIQQGNLNSEPEDVVLQQHAQDLLDALSQELSAPTVSVPPTAPTPESDLQAWLQVLISALEEEINVELSQVMHHANFQELESTWRGLHHLVKKTITSTELQLRVLDLTRAELDKDMEKGEDADFDQSELFKKVYEAEYDTLGGTPYGLLVGDYYFTSKTKDIATLTGVSRVASASFAPFITGSSPSFFNVETFEDILIPRDLDTIFATSSYIKWRSFRDIDESRYAALTLPRFLLRLPYGDDNPADNMAYFKEHVWDTEVKDAAEPDGLKKIGANGKNFLWGNSAFALSQRITNSFFNYGWFAQIRGVEAGGRVENLPIHLYNTPDGDTAVLIPTESTITDRREKELSDNGFISLCYRKNEDYAVFFGAQTAHSPAEYDNPEATANANLSARLTYILAACRFAHYIKVKMRDKIGTSMTKQQIQGYLNKWISLYVLLNDNAGDTVKAQFPLREARVDVYEDEANPGSYRAVVYLKPHFQLEELTVSLRLVANLPEPQA